MAHIDIIIGSTSVRQNMLLNTWQNNCRETMHDTIFALPSNPNLETLKANQPQCHLAGCLLNPWCRTCPITCPLPNELAKQPPQKTTLRYAVVALGDRNYDTF